MPVAADLCEKPHAKADRGSSHMFTASLRANRGRLQFERPNGGIGHINRTRWAAWARLRLAAITGNLPTPSLASSNRSSTKTQSATRWRQRRTPTRRRCACLFLVFPFDPLCHAPLARIAASPLGASLLSLFEILCVGVSAVNRVAETWRTGRQRTRGTAEQSTTCPRRPNLSTLWKPIIPSIPQPSPAQPNPTQPNLTQARNEQRKLPEFA